MAVPTLVQPHIPGMKQPVFTTQPVDAGLPLALTHLYPEGVKVFIVPPAGMVADDRLVLRLDGALVATKPIAIGEEDQRAVLYVQAKLWKDGPNTLDYGLERGGVEIETSHPLQVWFHRNRPGLVDRFPEEEGHSELQLSVKQVVLDEGVNPERAREGVAATLFYPLMRAFDNVQLDCNGVILTRLVTQADVDSGEPLVILIDEATFIKAGDAADFSLKFTVWDCVGNGPDTNNPYSVALSLYVNLLGIWNDSPIVSEDPADDEDDPDTIDLKKLAGRSATAQVYVSGTGNWMKGDDIRLDCRFQDATGDVQSLTLIKTVTIKPFMYAFSIPNESLVAASGGKATFRYTRVSDGVPLDRSETLTVRIIGAATSELLPPTLVGTGYKIHPLDFSNGVTARVEFLDAQDGDQARLVVNGAPGLGSPVFKAVNFNNNHRANFVLKPEVLAANHGGTMTLGWELLRAGGSQPSGEREVTVHRIEDADWRLPTPGLPQALGDEMLDLGAFSGHAQATCKSWPAIAVGQLRWFRLCGVGHDDKDYEITIAVGAPVTAPETTAGLDNALMRDLLLKFKPETTVVLELKVAFDGKNDERSAVVFKSREYQVLNLPTDVLEDFELARAQVVSKGGVMETANLRISFVSGSGECAIMPRSDIGQSFSRRVEGQVLSIGRDSNPPESVILELELKKACSRVSFWHLSVNYNDSFVEYLSADRTLLASKFLGTSYSTPQSLLHEADGIKIIRLVCPKPDWFSLDTIKVKY